MKIIKYTVIIRILNKYLKVSVNAISIEEVEFIIKDKILNNDYQIMNIIKYE